MQALRQRVRATCPVARLFDSASVPWEGAWGLGEPEENPKLPAEEPNGVKLCIGVTMEDDGKHSEITVDGDKKHRVILAEPEENGGSGKGPNPREPLHSILLAQEATHGLPECCSYHRRTVSCWPAPPFLCCGHGARDVRRQPPG